MMYSSTLMRLRLTDEVRRCGMWTIRQAAVIRTFSPVEPSRHIGRRKVPVVQEKPMIKRVIPIETAKIESEWSVPDGYRHGMMRAKTLFHQGRQLLADGIAWLKKQVAP